MSFSCRSLSQEWKQVYGDDINCTSNSLIELYDKGYLFGAQIMDSQGVSKVGWLFKTDINGNVIWEKKVDIVGNNTFIYDITQTIDNGIIIIGSTKKYDPLYDPYILKLNACGEKEWCKILNTPNDKDYGSKIIQHPNGCYYCLVHYTGINPNERIWLVCLNPSGDMIWKKVYGQGEEYLNSEYGYDLMLTPKSEILITGYGFYPDLPDTLSYKIRSFLINVDSNGNEKWALIWGKVNRFYSEARSSAISNDGTIYSVGTHYISSEKPTLLKTTHAGQEIENNDIDSARMGFSSTISWFSDSTLAVGSSWVNPNQKTVWSIIKYDTLLDTIKVRNLVDSLRFGFNNSVVSYDGKLLITTTTYWDGNTDIYAYKFNSQLEFDSIYTHSFVYDSLCPYPIESDTIPLDCSIVGIEEKEKIEKQCLQITPNPASEQIMVKLPDYICRQNKSSGFNVTTCYYQFSPDIKLEVFDIYGRKWKEVALFNSEKKTSFQISSLANGLYIVRTVIKGQIVSGKFVKE